MPTPFEVLSDPISLSILAIYALLILWEGAFPARSLPNVRWWRVRGIASFFAFFFLSTYLPLWYARWMPEVPLFNWSGWHPVAAGAAGVLLYEFGMYVWHRSIHKNNVLWRVFHQMHHSAERLDTYGAFYFSPLDMIGWTILGSVCFGVIAGLPPQGVTIVLLVTNFFSIFQHANIKTPVWLGYIIQRPESHAVHHARGIHSNNYSDLPLFDLIFGTFVNPKDYVKETGFYDGASERVGEMLRFKDVDNKAA